MPAPVASGWSVRRVGLAPTGKRRLFTAHAGSGPIEIGHPHDIATSLTVQFFETDARHPLVSCNNRRSALSRTIEMRVKATSPGR